MVASGRVPDRPLVAVQAYLDLRNFGSLPTGGGLWSLPAFLVEEMRVVASHVNLAAKRRADRERADAERSSKRFRIRR